MNSNPTLATRSTQRLLSVTSIATVVGLLALATYIELRVPGFTVPFTLQTLIAILAGVALGPARATAAVALYVSLRLVGVIGMVPALATAGYLLGMILAAALVGRLTERRRSLVQSFGIYSAALGMTLVLGASWLALLVAGGASGIAVDSFGAIFWSGLLIFVPFELAKAAIACGLTPGLSGRVRSLFGGVAR